MQQSRSTCGLPNASLHAGCYILPLPRSAAVDLMVVAMVVGLATAPMRPQAWFARLSPPLVSKPATAMVACVGDDSVRRVDDGAGRGVGDDTHSRVGGGTSDVFGETVCIWSHRLYCGSVSGHLRRGRRLHRLGRIRR